MKPFENTVEKGENDGNQHFLLLPQCFLHFSKQISIASHILGSHLKKKARHFRVIDLLHRDALTLNH